MKQALTNRENRILILLLNGHAENQIAELLQLKVKTILADIERIQDKWEVSSVAGVAVEACRRGMISLLPYSSISSVAHNYTTETLNVIQIPERFFSNKNGMSLPKLLKRTGYLKLHLVIDEFLIKHVLSKNPQYIVQWMQLAEENLDSGWYICKEKAGNYLVGSMPKDEPPSVLEYAELDSACAVYIKREIEYIRLKYINA